MILLTENLKSLNIQRAHHYATLWLIERTDGVNLRFTDHDCPLTLADGTVYTPAGGFGTSARQKKVDMQSRNVELAGLLSSSAITNDDLRAGRYREAKVTETLVDWRFPWAGILHKNVYWVAEVTFTGSHWEAQLQGLSKWLKPSIGNVYSRTCRHDLGDSICRVDLGPLTLTGTVTSIISQRRYFDSNRTGNGDEWFTHGLLTWTSGLNNGLKFEVADYQNNGEFKLHLHTPFDIAIGDTFSVYPGCKKTIGVCLDKFDNVINFGGFPHIPGTAKALQTPKAKV
jgi:uncharacterized phage protein (TIGR02218 family)